MFAIDKDRLESVYVLEPERKDGGFRAIVKIDVITDFIEI